MTRRNRRRKQPRFSGALHFLNGLRASRRRGLRDLVPDVSKRKSPRKTIAPIIQTSRGYLVVLCLAIFLAVTGLVYHLHIRFETVELGYQTSKARAERARLLLEQRELRLELATLKEPRRIESEARDKLEMRVPSHEEIIPIGKRRRSVLAAGGAH